MTLGRSTDPDGFAAGSAATSSAFAAAGQEPRLVIVFCSPAYDVAAVLHGICSQTPDDVPITGVTTDGEIGLQAAGNSAGPNGGDQNSGNQHADPQAPSVLVTVLGGDTLTVHAEMVRDLSADQHAAGTAVAKVMNGVDAPHRVLMLLLDGLTANHEVVWGAYAELGVSVPIVGGCAADGDQHVVTYQFYGTGATAEVLTDTVIGIGIGSTAPIGIGIEHGWEKFGDAMVVTSSEGGEVHLLDDEPALDVYLRRLGMDREQFAARKPFLSESVRIPLAMSRRFGEDIRLAHAGDLDTGSIHCLADIPQGAMVWTMRSDTDSLVNAASRSAGSAVRALDDAPLAGMLVFDCGGRRLRLGDAVPAEHQALRQATDGAPVAGFYSFGEVARTRGARGLHHLTVVTLAFA